MSAISSVNGTLINGQNPIKDPGHFRAWRVSKGYISDVKSGHFNYAKVLMAALPIILILSLLADMARALKHSLCKKQVKAPAPTKPSLPPLPPRKPLKITLEESPSSISSPIDFDDYAEGCALVFPPSSSLDLEFPTFHQEEEDDILRDLPLLGLRPDQSEDSDEESSFDPIVEQKLATTPATTGKRRKGVTILHLNGMKVRYSK